jgi:hypothetical protein
MDSNLDVVQPGSIDLVKTSVWFGSVKADVHAAGFANDMLGMLTDGMQTLGDSALSNTVSLVILDPPTGEPVVTEGMELTSGKTTTSCLFLECELIHHSHRR